MSYDFLTEFRLSQDEKVIDSVVRSQGKYAMLKDAPWTIRAQVLATGIIFNSLKDSIKNGRKAIPRKDIKEIKGYPGVVVQSSSYLSSQWKKLFVPDLLMLSSLPKGSCLVRIKLRLTSPFYSQDDISFYPTDNLLRRDHLFHVPYLGASGIKGMLRWAWRMCYEDEYKDDMETAIFGPRPGEGDDENSIQGCLYTWPLFWNGSVVEDIINPQDREKKCGKDPVRYEVVKAGALGELCLMLVNRHGNLSEWKEKVEKFLEVLKYLLENSGLSAKRTSGWGCVKPESARGWIAGVETDLEEKADDTKKNEDVAALWAQVCDEKNELLPEDSTEITKKLLSRLTGKSVKLCTGKNRAETYKILKQKYKEYRQKMQEEQRKQGDMKEMETGQKPLKQFPSIDSLIAALKGMEEQV